MTTETKRNGFRSTGDEQPLSRFTNAQCDALPFPAVPAAPAETSASAASGTTNEFSSNFSSSLISSGKRRPGSTVTAKTSCTAVSNRKSATTLPGGQIDRADAASPLLLGQPLGDRDAAEDGALANLREPDEGEVAGEVDARG